MRLIRILQVLAATLPTMASAATFTLEDLGSLPAGGDSYAHAVSSHGIVGAAINAAGEQRAFIWSPADGMTEIGTLVGSSFSAARAVNSRGEVVGESSTFGGQFGSSSRAFHWSRATGLRDLAGLPGSIFTIASGINDAGEVVGTSSGQRSDGTLGSRAFHWTAATGLRELGMLPGGRTSAAYGINALGVVAGAADEVGADGIARMRAVIWTQGAIESLGTLAGHVESAAVGLNDRGEVVGWSAGPGPTGAWQMRAFLWSRSTGMRDLGTLTGGADSAAFGVNDEGLVVGQASAASGLSHAFVWSAEFGLADLGTFAGGNQSYATGIDAQNTIVGYASGVSTTLGRYEHAFRVELVPPPVANAGPDQTVPCAGAAARVRLDGSASRAASGGALTYTWSLGTTVLARTAEPVVEVILREGRHAISLVVTEGGRDSFADETIVTAVDVEAPVSIADVSPAPNAHGWNNTPVDVLVSATDAATSVRDVRYSLNGAPEVVVPGSAAALALTREGAHELRHRATDAAGNASAPSAPVAVRIDSTLPQVRATVSPLPTSRGTWFTDVTVTFSGSDALSGLDSVSPPIVLTQRGTRLSATGWALDKAGNRAEVTVSDILIERLPPLIDVTFDSPWGTPTYPTAPTAPGSGTTPPDSTHPGSTPGKGTTPPGKGRTPPGTGTTPPPGTTPPGTGTTPPPGTTPPGTGTTPPGTGTTPPVATLVLWPPNHRMAKMTFSGRLQDHGAGGRLRLTLTSNEPDDARGMGDGKTYGDTDGADGFTRPVIRYGQADANGNFTVDVFVRAERAANGNGRIYRIAVTSEFDENNDFAKWFEIRVPKNRSKR